MSDKEGYQDIYLVRADGTGLKNLTGSVGNSKDPAWSPDGTQLAFASDRNGGWDLFLLDLESGELRQLTTHPENDSSPSWSPDGSQIAFTSDRAGPFAIHVLDLVDGCVVPLTDSKKTNVLDIFPAWSPSGEWISFNRLEQGAVLTATLCWITPEGKDEQCLEIGDQGEASEQSWSPDGRQLAFYWTTPDIPFGRIFVVRLDNDDLRQLTTSWAEWPAWSPDGLMIAYESPIEGARDLWVMNSQGTGHQRLTTDEELVDVIEAPAWSPDGRRIAFVSGFLRGATDLYLIDVDGSNLTKIMTNRTQLFGQPTWRPQ